MFYDPQELAGPSNTKRRLPYAMNNVNQSSREENSKSITDERHSTILEKESVYRYYPGGPNPTRGKGCVCVCA